MGLSQSSENLSATDTVAASQRKMIVFTIKRAELNEPKTYSWCINQIQNDTDLCAMRQLVLDLTASHNEEFPHSRLSAISIEIVGSRSLLEPSFNEDIPSVVLKAMALTLSKCDRPAIPRLYSKPLSLQFDFSDDWLRLQFVYLLYHMLLSVGIATYPSNLPDRSDEKTGFLVLMLHNCATSLRTSRTGPVTNMREFRVLSTPIKIMNEALLTRNIERYVCTRTPREIAERNNNNNNNNDDFDEEEAEEQEEEKEEENPDLLELLNSPRSKTEDDEDDYGFVQARQVQPAQEIDWGMFD